MRVAGRYNSRTSTLRPGSGYASRGQNTFVIPTMLTRIIDVLDGKTRVQAAFPRLAAIAYGGGKYPFQYRANAEAAPDVNFTNAYGLTETSSTIRSIRMITARPSLILTCGRAWFSGQSAATSNSKYETRMARQSQPALGNLRTRASSIR